MVFSRYILPRFAHGPRSPFPLAPSSHALTRRFTFETTITIQSGIEKEERPSLSLTPDILIHFLLCLLRYLNSQKIFWYDMVYSEVRGYAIVYFTGPMLFTAPESYLCLVAVPVKVAIGWPSQAIDKEYLLLSLLRSIPRRRSSLSKNRCCFPPQQTSSTYTENIVERPTSSENRQ